MEEMKLRDEDRDDLDRAKVDAAEVKEASERYFHFIWSVFIA